MISYVGNYAFYRTRTIDIYILIHFNNSGDYTRPTIVNGASDLPIIFPKIKSYIELIKSINFQD